MQDADVVAPFGNIHMKTEWPNTSTPLGKQGYVLADFSCVSRPDTDV